MSERQDIPLSLRAARETFSSWDGFLAMGFGSGLLPRAPGTWGTVVALAIWPVMAGFQGSSLWWFLILTFAFGVWICERVGDRLGVSDYGGIVWDEWVGLWLCLAWLPAHWGWWLAGFAAFRFFDIVKPWPIRAMERRLGGGLGVMLDDVVAAVFAAILLAGIQQLLAG